mmetsp:Transcript_19203/g.51719  ORF Transcript_19203/g.51719 Transcript_19203/m.51719 type:complete len:643 (+) Transcript_19203:68-1996(+)
MGACGSSRAASDRLRLIEKRRTMSTTSPSLLGDTGVIRIPSVRGISPWTLPKVKSLEEARVDPSDGQTLGSCLTQLFAVPYLRQSVPRGFSCFPRPRKSHFGVRLATLQLLRDRAQHMRTHEGPPREGRGVDGTRPVRRPAGTPLSTEDVLHEIVRVDTKETRGSWLEWLEMQMPGHAAQANVYVVHSWAAPFEELTESIEDAGFNSHSAVFWVDLLSLSTWDEEGTHWPTRAASVSPRMHTLKHSLVILSPWYKPAALADLWCLFEMAMATKAAGDVHIRIPKAHHQVFDRAVAKDLESVKKVMVDADITGLTNASRKAGDGLADAVLEGGGVGVSELAERVTLLMRAWLIQASMRVVLMRRSDLNLMRAMADLLEEHEAWGELEEHLRQMLRISEEEKGGKHADTVGLVRELADLLMEEGKLEAAAHMYRRALNVLEQGKGWNHPDTLDVVLSAAQVATMRGRFGEAEAFFSHARVGFAPNRPDHPGALATAHGYGAMLQRKGHFAQAEVHLRRALAGREAVLGKEHPDTRSTCLQLASVLDDLGREAEAIELYTRASEGSVGAFRFESSIINGEDGSKEDMLDAEQTALVVRNKRYAMTLEARRNYPTIAQGPVAHRVHRLSTEGHQAAIPGLGPRHMV